MLNPLIHGQAIPGATDEKKLEGPDHLEITIQVLSDQKLIDEVANLELAPFGNGVAAPQEMP